MIVTRNISPDDYHLIEELSYFPKDLFLGLHNFFTLNKRNLIGVLERHIDVLEDHENEKKEFLGIYLELANRYDWSACWNINIIFERRKKQ